VNTATTARVHGSVYRAPVSTGRVGKKHCTTTLFANTAREHGCSLHTTRVHKPSRRTREHGPSRRAVIDNGVIIFYLQIARVTNTAVIKITDRPDCMA